MLKRKCPAKYEKSTSPRTKKLNQEFHCHGSDDSCHDDEVSSLGLAACDKEVIGQDEPALCRSPELLFTQCDVPGAWESPELCRAQQETRVLHDSPEPCLTQRDTPVRSESPELCSSYQDVLVSCESPGPCLTQRDTPVRSESPELYSTHQDVLESCESSDPYLRQHDMPVECRSPEMCFSPKNLPVSCEDQGSCHTESAGAGLASNDYINDKQNDLFNETDSFLAELDSEYISVSTADDNSNCTQTGDKRALVDHGTEHSSRSELTSTMANDVTTTEKTHYIRGICDGVYPETGKHSAEPSGAVLGCTGAATLATTAATTSDKFSSPMSTSFRERIRSRLLQNTKTPTLPSPRSLQFGREEMIEQAIREATDLKQRLLSQPDNNIETGSFYGLSDKVKDLLSQHRGITKLYDWQHECLSLPALKSHSNLIYSLPTSGGKTLVAEILIWQELLLHRKDAIFILPYVSIVQEKVRGLSPFAIDLNFHVEEYAASKGMFPPKKRRSKNTVFICTIEKANSLVNSLIEHQRLEQIGLVIIDELHMVGEGGSRGAVLEMTLTKVMHASPESQLVGMSATLSNIEDLQKFLHAEVYSSNFRPVELKEYIKIEENLYKVDHNMLCPDEKLKHHSVLSYKYTPHQLRLDPDQLAALVLEVVPKHSCLVFCATKKNCENVAQLICQFMSRKMLEEKKAKRLSLMEALRYDGNGQICRVLRRTVPYGVAYHHSGLTMDERKLIEEAYSEGTLCVIVCTSTLAAGVNLPAKRVILRSPYIANQFLTTSRYKQMTGRAGRAGIDTSGESILITPSRDRIKVLDLVSGPFESCQSSLLYEDKKGISSLLLTTIGLQITKTKTSVIEFLRKTLCYIQRDRFDLDLQMVSRESLQHLVDLKLIKLHKSESGSGLSEDTLEVSRLGKAVMKGSIDLERGPQLYRDLNESLKSLDLANYLHLLYLVTPYDLTDLVKPDWQIYLNELAGLDPGEVNAYSLIGVTDGYIARKISGQKPGKRGEDDIMKRFYLTLMLYNLWKQKSIWNVATKFNQSRGFIQQLLNSTASFAACVNHFCEELDEFWAYKELLGTFVKRLSYCVTMELIPLLEIPGVKIGRARQLYRAGYKTLQLLAYADPEQLIGDIEHLPRKTSKQIVSSAQMLLQQQAEALMEEVDDLFAIEVTT